MLSIQIALLTFLPIQREVVTGFIVPAKDLIFNCKDMPGFAERGISVYQSNLE